MSSDAVLRIIAVAAAAALVAAPYWRQIRDAGRSAAAAAREHGASLCRTAAALLIVAAAWGYVPLPTLPASPAVTVTVDAPSEDMQRLVEPVTKALGSLSPADRSLWASVWLKAALVVKAEKTSTQPAFPDTPALRQFTTVALDIGWRRLGDHPTGSLPGLREAVEAAMRTAMGLDAVPVTGEMRARYVEVARAIAWAGTR